MNLPTRLRQYPGRFFIFRIVGIDGWIVLSILLIAVLMCHAYALRFSWMVHYNAYLFDKLFLRSAFLPICGAALVIHLFRLRKSGLSQQDFSWREFRRIAGGTFITVPNVASLARATVVFMLLTTAISHVKPMIPLVNPRLYDEPLLAFDVLLFGGFDIYKWFAAHRPAWLLFMMNFGYASLFYLTCFTFSILFVQKRRHALKWFILALVVAQLLGHVIYYALPSMGDIFIRKELYDSIPNGSLVKTWMVGLEKLRRTLLETPSQWEATPWQGIAALPSLHVAYCALFLYFARRYHRWALPVYIPVCLLLIVSTVWFGIHYILDLVVGYPLGLFSIWVARRVLIVNELLLRRGQLKRRRPPLQPEAQALQQEREMVAAGSQE